MILYEIVKEVAGIGFNLINIILGGNLPPFGCVCILVEKDTQLLVIKRPNGELVLPGGFMRWREHPQQTAEREGREETGLQLRTREIVGYYPIISKRFNRMSTLNLIYKADVIAGTLRPSIEGIPFWLSIDEATQQLSSFYRTIVIDYMKSHADTNTQ